MNIFRRIYQAIKDWNDRPNTFNFDPQSPDADEAVIEAKDFVTDTVKMGDSKKENSNK